MFEKFNNLKNMVRIIFSKEKLYVTSDGRILDKRYKAVETKVDAKGHSAIAIETERYGTVIFRVCDIVAIHYKWLDHLNFDILLDVEAFHLDGNIANNHASNLGYRFKTTPKESVNHIGYYYIPGYPYRVINKEGDIKNDNTGKSLKMAKLMPTNNSGKNITGGYLVNNFRLNNSTTNMPITRHRAMLLAFKYIPDNIESLVCNHINGVPGDDRLENLEWVTRKRNLAHAYETGLRSQNRPVLVKNVLTNEINEYFSVAEAARQLNVNDRGFNQMLEQRPFGSVNSKGHQIKYKSDERDWVILDDPEKAVQLARQRIEVKARNCKTLETFIFSSIGEASKQTGIDGSSIGYRFGISDYSPLFGWQFIPAELTIDFPDFTEEDYIKSLEVGNKPVDARNLITGETKLFKSISLATRFIGVNFQESLRNGRQPLYPNGWQFKFTSDEWEDIEDVEFKLYSLQKEVMSYDIETGKIVLYDSVSQVNDMTGLKNDKIRRSALSYGEIPYKGFRFHLGNNPKVFDKFKH